MAPGRMSTATIRDVAREASVSLGTTSRALNGHANVTDATRQRVLAAARKLNYVPHAGARSLTMRQSNAIGVVLPDLFGEFFSEIIRGIDSAAHPRGFQLLLSNMHGSAKETAAAIRTMRGRVDGLLVMSPHVDADFLSQNLPKGLPVVVMNGWIDGEAHASIVIDSFAGARMMVAHLVERGFRRIAHISGPAGNSDAEERLRGFREAVAEQLDDRDPIVLTGNFDEKSGYEAGRIVAADSRRIDAVFAANDMMAVGCMAALSAAGLSVPDNIAVAGFDDVPIARYVTPALTTMRVHIAELGAQALKVLVDTIARPQSSTLAPQRLTPELVVRQSTGTPKRSARGASQPAGA